MGRKIAAYSNSDLLLEYERVLSEAVKAANGWNRRSEDKLNREAVLLALYPEKPHIFKCFTGYL